MSFGSPVTNEWYQIIVVNGQVQVRNLGKLARNGRSLRETINEQVRVARKTDHYRTKKPLAARAAHVGGVMPESSGA